MSITQKAHKDSYVFWQEWSDGNAAEPAILIEKYSYSILLIQGDDSITISAHEVKNFIKELQKIAKEG